MADSPKWESVDLPRPAGVDPRATARVLRVAPEFAGTRLDVFLSLALKHTSRTRAKLIAHGGAYSPQGTSLRPNQRVKAEQRIVLWRVPVDELDDELELPILYEDEHLLAINKPPGIAVHPTASHFHRTVTRVLEARRPGEYLRLVHRLDRDTSGVLLLARSPDADRAFKMLLEGTLRDPRIDPTVSKTYQAITWGVPPEGLVERPLLRDETNPMRVKMKIVPDGFGLPAGTEVRVQAQCDGYALVQCKLLTGRQHQIRVHLASLGTPVVGDRLYGPDERLHAKGADGRLDDADYALLEMPRQALHAFRYELTHALTAEALELEAALPADMREFWSSRSGVPFRAPRDPRPEPHASSTPSRENSPT